MITLHRLRLKPNPFQVISGGLQWDTEGHRVDTCNSIDLPLDCADQARLMRFCSCKPSHEVIVPPAWAFILVYCLLTTLSIDTYVYFHRVGLLLNTQALTTQKNLGRSAKAPCRWWDSNPHGTCVPADFKSAASAIPPQRLNASAGVRNAFGLVEQATRSAGQ